MRLGWSNWTEERREKHRAWARAHYQRRKNDPVYQEQVRRQRALRRSDPAKVKADVAQVVAREKQQKRTPELWPGYALHSSRRRAAKYGIPHTISATDIVIPSACPVFGVPFVFDGPKWHPHAPSLDRFKPELGYVPGNIRVICLRANRLKWNGTAEELRQVLNYMENLG